MTDILKSGFDRGKIFAQAPPRADSKIATGYDSTCRNRNSCFDSFKRKEKMAAIVVAFFAWAKYGLLVERRGKVEIIDNKKE